MLAPDPLELYALMFFQTAIESSATLIAKNFPILITANMQITAQSR